MSAPPSATPDAATEPDSVRPYDGDGDGIPGCIAVYLGEVDYGVAWRLQQLLVEERATGGDPGAARDVLLLCQHPDAQANILSRRFPLYEIERGGDVTYHGPGQLVGYPIVWLRPGRGGPRPEDRWGERDLHAYLRCLEEGLCRLCAECGVAADRREGLTGVWTADGARKLASMGIAVRRWVAFHGFALNVTTDLSRFAAMNPCGLSAQVMTSLAALGARYDQQPVRVESLLEPAARCIGAALNRRFSLVPLADSGLDAALAQAREEAIPPVDAAT
jgi:lipoyl(octanoyl) transferase